MLAEMNDDTAALSRRFVDPAKLSVTNLRVRLAIRDASTISSTKSPSPDAITMTGAVERMSIAPLIRAMWWSVFALLSNPD
jgi:hypothetical protein